MLQLVTNKWKKGNNLLNDVCVHLDTIDAKGQVTFS